MPALLNLTDPRVDRTLRSMLIGAALIAAAWTGLVAYESTSARAAVSAQSGQLEAKKSEMDQQDITFRARRRVSLGMGDVPAAAPFRGTAQFAYDVDRLVRGAGGSVMSLRFGAKSQDPSGQNDDSSSTDTFECTITGSYPSLVTVLDGFASPQSTATVVSTDLSRDVVDPKTGMAQIQMRIEGKLDQ